MYMIGWISALKIFFTRHNPALLRSHNAYMLIAFIVLVGVVGVVSLSYFFKYIVCKIQYNIIKNVLKVSVHSMKTLHVFQTWYYYIILLFELVMERVSREIYEYNHTFIYC